jgi:hypothetical protein
MEGKQEEEKRKGLISKLKDAAEDTEHHLQVLGTFVRLGVVVWSGFIITLNYVELPMIKKTQNTDITFVASIFGSALYSFGLQTNNSNSKNANATPINCPMTKKKEE